MGSKVNKPLTKEVLHSGEKIRIILSQNYKL